jgi:hypothetical protein
VLRADRSPEIEGSGVHLIRDSPQLGNVVGLAEVEERPGVDLSGRGMNQVGRRRLVPLQNILNAV